MGEGPCQGKRNTEMALGSILNKNSILIFLLIAEFWRHGNLQERDNRSETLHFLGASGLWFLEANWGAITRPHLFPQEMSFSVTGFLSLVLRKSSSSDFTG